MCAAFTLYGAGYARSVADSAATPGKSSRRSITSIATCALTSFATGIGWYGVPFQQAGGLEAPGSPQSMVRAVRSFGFWPSTFASLASTACCWSSGSFASTERSTVITSETRLPTSVRPAASTIVPRGAWTSTSRVWFCVAACE